MGRAVHQEHEAVEPLPEGKTDAVALERALRARVRGEVHFDAGARTLYATDASNYWQTPIGVVVPLDEEDVVATMHVCRQHDAPILARGGGTSLAGQACNVAVVLDFSKHMHRVLAIDPETRTATIQPGVVLDDLRNEANRHGLTFGPDPSTHDRCTLGGMLGNNSCGVHSLTTGTTAANVLEMEVVLYDGSRFTLKKWEPDELQRLRAGDGRLSEIVRGLWMLQERHAAEIRRRFPDIPRRVSGYNLDALLPEQGFDLAKALVGTEGTCAMILGAKVRLVPEPGAKVLVVIGYDDITRAADDVPRLLEHHPFGLEAVDGRIVQEMKEKDLHTRHLRGLPEGDGWLLAEFGGDAREDAVRAARRLGDDLDERGLAWHLVEDEARQAGLWQVRESGLPADARGPGRPDTFEGWEDSAVAPERLGDYLRGLGRLWSRYGYDGSMYGHFGDGCVHTRITFDLTSTEGVRRFRDFIDEAADLVVSHGGSLSGEHGDGQSRADLLPRMFGNQLVAAFQAFKRIWDPEGRMNPGKVVDAYAPVNNLRLGPDVRPIEVDSDFAYPDEGGSLYRAATRCVGVGLCRRSSGGIMCPSYMVTREEKHSTRGRARLLEGMLRGDVLQDAWKSEAVKEALDLCLSCKGCKGECPMGVDMATYKADFLSHYYEGRLRPRSAYAMGQIRRVARLARFVPRLANLTTQTPGLRRMTTWAAGVHPERRLPAFAPRTFQRTYRHTSTDAGTATRPGHRVVLLPDTFYDHFHPGVLHAAAGLLTQAGYDVSLPQRPICCGRPLYDHGWVKQAKKSLLSSLETLGSEVEAGAVVVGCEPSCMAVFRDELHELIPDHPLATEPSAWAKTLGEALADSSSYMPPQREGTVLVQGHCHERSVMDMEPEMKLLRLTGADVRLLHEGCCGMAGSFGFEQEKYEVSTAVAEHGILPALAEAPAGSTILTDGFSCRTQVEQMSGHRPMHLAEYLRDQ